jgi:hypothetical protein
MRAMPSAVLGAATSLSTSDLMGAVDSTSATAAILGQNYKQRKEKKSQERRRRNARRGKMR